MSGFMDAAIRCRGKRSPFGMGVPMCSNGFDSSSIRCARCAPKKQKMDKTRQVGNTAKGKWLRMGVKYLLHNRVWDAVAIKRDYPDLCFEFLVGEKCTQGLSDGHGFAGDTAHTLPKPREVLKEQYSTPYDPNHSTNLIK